MAESNKKEPFMECAKIEVTVPKEMQVYFSDDYAVDSVEELKRNALLLYPYIHNNVISHGRAAEILGVKKLDLIELYDNMGFPYFDMDIGEVLQDIQTFRSIKKGLAFSDSLISKVEAKDAIAALRDSGRHISELLYEQLLKLIENQ